MNHDYDKSVFVNCPFDMEYQSLLWPILFTLLRLKFTIRIASERFDSGETRFSKICELIRESKYGIHDLSRIKAKKKGEYFRLNMPFEFGLDIGCRVFYSDKYSDKLCLVLEEKKYECQKAISDISNSDTKAHGNNPVQIVKQVRNWLAENGLHMIPGPTTIWNEFTDFMDVFYAERENDGLTKEEIYDIQPKEFIDYANKWLNG